MDKNERNKLRFDQKSTKTMVICKLRMKGEKIKSNEEEKKKLINRTKEIDETPLISAQLRERIT